MCGILAIAANSSVNQLLYEGLTVLQHRGQDAAGIATCDDSRIFLKKSNGLVRDVFQADDMIGLLGNMGVGHVRYPTAGNSSTAEAQPFYVNSPYGITLAHNGNLINSEKLKTDLFDDELRHINTDSDSEVLLNVFAQELHKLNKKKINPEDIFFACSKVFERCKGAYSVVAMITGVGIVAFRDMHGIRPIVYGARETDFGEEFVVASESVAIDVLGFNLVRDIRPGEALFINSKGEFFSEQCVAPAGHLPCLFEHVYFARPDSIIDGISVHKARMRMGEALANKIVENWFEHDIDVVIPIPDTARTAALELANVTGIKYREGFIKNRYIARTFIMPGQAMRQRSVRQKLNAIDLEFAGKNVLLVDDSIVRGTTSKQIIEMAREAGANKVYFASAAPPVRFPNVYGIDMPTREELIAYNRTEAQVRKILGADGLIYQDLEELVISAQRGNPEILGFEQSCFSGEYITGGVSEEYLRHLGINRSDAKKLSRSTGGKPQTDLFSRSMEVG
tara:strand:- start:2399 stop:3922 length:1524 start_codon:yes stop_codon:yes gene_type:complete